MLKRKVAIHDEIFTGKTKKYNEAILKTLLFKKELRSQEIARELYYIFYDLKKDKKIPAKDIKPINDNLSGSKGRLKDLTNKEFIRKTITKKANECKYSGEGDRYSLTYKKGFYTALMLLKRGEVSKSELLVLFLEREFDTILYLLTMLTNEEHNWVQYTHDEIRNSFNQLLCGEYDLKNMSNEQFNRRIRVGCDFNLSVTQLLNDEVFEKLIKLPKDDHDKYFEFLDDVKEYAKQTDKHIKQQRYELKQQSEEIERQLNELDTELCNALNCEHLAGFYQKKLKLLEAQSSQTDKKETTKNGVRN
jgi:hypothetical protein